MMPSKPSTRRRKRRLTMQEAVQHVADGVRRRRYDAVTIRINHGGMGAAARAAEVSTVMIGEWMRGAFPIYTEIYAQLVAERDASVWCGIRLGAGDDES